MILHPYFSAIAAVDFETYYDNEYSLRSRELSQTDYIRDERFECQSLSVQLNTWAKPVTVPGNEAGDLLASIDWSETAFLAHHTNFDGLIATHHYNVEPVFWLDTMAMSRPVYGVDAAHSLVALAARLGLKGKPRADALNKVKGVRLADMDPELLQLLMEYNEDDTGQLLEMYRKLQRFVPLEEMRIIDMTIRMYCEPLLELDEQRLRQLHEREANRRALAIELAGTDKRTLGSSQRFADLLRSRGVEPPMKLSKTTGEPTYAFARTDLAFKELLQHPDELVSAAVEARLRTKSALIENRSERLLRRVGLPTPVYLSYWAARTGRWGGGDKVNLQNLPRRGDGAELRYSLMAPEGTLMVIADAAQIEARMVAWLADHEVKLEAFRNNEDTYSVTASGVYGFEVNQIDNPDERFSGKVLDLSCQYGSGGKKVSTVFKLGIMGPPIDMSVEEAKDLVNRWRTTNAPIVQLWRRLEDAASRAFLQGTPVEFGPVAFEGFKGDGYIHLPNGTFMKYPQVGFDPNEGSMYYNSKNGATKIWGGYLLENVAQALSCVLLKQQMLWMVDEMADFRIATTTHDEVLCLVPTAKAEEYAGNVLRIMSTNPCWAEGLPLNAEVKVSEIYNKA